MDIRYDRDEHLYQLLLEHYMVVKEWEASEARFERELAVLSDQIDSSMRLEAMARPAEMACSGE